MNIETSDGRTYTNNQKSGAIMVALGDSALFSLSYTGLTEDEAMALAQKFDWKAMQAAALKK